MVLQILCRSTRLRLTHLESDKNGGQARQAPIPHRNHAPSLPPSGEIPSLPECQQPIGPVGEDPIHAGGREPAHFGFVVGIEGIHFHTAPVRIRDEVLVDLGVARLEDTTSCRGGAIDVGIPGLGGQIAGGQIRSDPRRQPDRILVRCQVGRLKQLALLQGTCRLRDNLMPVVVIGFYMYVEPNLPCQKLQKVLER